MEETKMSTPLPGSTAPEPDPARLWLRWWHVLLFFLPTIVSVGTTWVLVEMTRAKDAASGFTSLSDYGRAHIMDGPGLVGFMVGAGCCVVSAVVLGLTTKARYPVLSCLGWAVLSVIINLTLSEAGCGVLERHLSREHPAEER